MTTSPRMAHIPVEHPWRASLSAEVHARPPTALQTPLKASYVAVMVDPSRRHEEREHLRLLCERQGWGPPASSAVHFSAETGALRFKWERHGEFSGFTLVWQGPESALEASAWEALHTQWLSQLPGQTIAAVKVDAQRSPLGQALTADFLRQQAGEGTVVGSLIGEGAGAVLTDFRTQGDGFVVVRLFDQHLTPAQCGRTLQRLFEIEAYRVLSLLALPLAREQAPRIQTIESELAGLMSAIAKPGTHAMADDEQSLVQLVSLAAEMEGALAASQFRYGACRAYADLVATRIEELREVRVDGLQTLAEFMNRRFRPAVSTCVNVNRRLHDVSTRVAQASSLLRTRVDISRAHQNQALLSSMDRKARMQLRLQQTVEGLSMAAIGYYVASLVGYAAKAGKSVGWPLSPDLTVGLALPVIFGALWWALRRARSHFGEEDAPPQF